MWRNWSNLDCILKFLKNLVLESWAGYVNWLLWKLLQEFGVINSSQYTHIIESYAYIFSDKNNKVSGWMSMIMILDTTAHLRPAVSNSRQYSNYFVNTIIFYHFLNEFKSVKSLFSILSTFNFIFDLLIFVFLFIYKYMCVRESVCVYTYIFLISYILKKCNKYL